MRQPAPARPASRNQASAIDAHAIAARCLPTHRHAQPAQREADIEDVLTWARGAHPYVTRREATILAVEQRHQWAWTRRHDRLTFGAKAHLVRVRRDGAGCRARSRPASSSPGSGCSPAGSSR